jgi:hypothetical protein
LFWFQITNVEVIQIAKRFVHDLYVCEFHVAAVVNPNDVPRVLAA